MSGKTTRKRKPIVTAAVLVCALVVVALVVVAVLSFRSADSGDSTAASHDSPVPIAERYLAAIAAGDADAAHLLDGAAFETAPHSRVGVDLLSDDVMAVAQERIADVSVSLISATESKASVQTQFSLAGETYTPRVFFEWDEARDDWIITSSLSNILDVYSFTTETDRERLPFTVEGLDATLQQSADAGSLLGYAMYPGVYLVTPTIEAGTLADPGAAFREVTVFPYDQEGVLPAADFELKSD